MTEIAHHYTVACLTFRLGTVLCVRAAEAVRTVVARARRAHNLRGRRTLHAHQLCGLSSIILFLFSIISSLPTFALGGLLHALLQPRHLNPAIKRFPLSVQAMPQSGVIGSTGMSPHPTLLLSWLNPTGPPPSLNPKRVFSLSLSLEPPAPTRRAPCRWKQGSRRVGAGGMLYLERSRCGSGSVAERDGHRRSSHERGVPAALRVAGSLRGCASPAHSHTPCVR